MALQALSDERKTRLSTTLAGTCIECRQPVCAIDYHHESAGGDYHGACWQAELDRRNAPRPVRVWRYHAHGENWGGSDGTVKAVDKDQARARVLAWVDRQGVLGDDSVGGADEMGAYVSIEGPID